MISPVGQMLRAIEVVISIVYLATQIRNKQGKPTPGDDRFDHALE